MIIRRLALACALAFAASASAANSTNLLKTTSTWDGAAIRYVGANCPEVDAVVVDIPPNGATPIHLHPMNNYAYVLEGEVTVQMGDVANGELVTKKTATFKKGDAFAELVNTWHRGVAGSGGVKILVWYTTEVGRPFSVAYSPDYKGTQAPGETPRCEAPREAQN